MTLVTPQTSFSLASGNPVSTAGATVDFDHSESEPGDKHLVHAQTMLSDALPAPPFTPKELPKGAGTPDTPLEVGAFERQEREGLETSPLQDA